MSLVVARQADGEITIVSETKLTYPNHDIKHSKTDPSDGIIKSVIINDYTCVSFAGEIEYAQAALEEIQEDHTPNVIIQILKKYHQISLQKTEFILCYLNPAPIIYKFKNNEYGEVHSTWIGDQAAFNLFQSLMMDDGKTKQTGKKSSSRDSRPKGNGPLFHFEEVSMSISGSTNSLGAKMSGVMDKVIETGVIKSVGGFKVHVKMKDNAMYNFYSQLYRGDFTIEGLTSFAIGHGEAPEGAYSILFFGGSPNHQHVAIHIRQGDFGIVYSRTNRGLLKPSLLKLDEVDFVDKMKEEFNVLAPFTTMDRTDKFAKDGLAAFQQNNYIKALECFDKSLITAKDKKKAELHFYRGVTFLNLRNLTAAQNAFGEAIDIDPAIKERVAMVFAQRPK